MFIPVWGLVVVLVVIIYLISSKINAANRYKELYCNLYRKWGKQRWEFERLSHLHLWDKFQMMEMLTNEQKEEIAKNVFGQWAKYDDWDGWDTSNLHSHGADLIQRELKAYFREYDYHNANIELCNSGWQSYDALNSK